MSTKTSRYIWQQPGWPAMTFDLAQLAHSLAAAEHMQGLVQGMARAIGMADHPALQAEIFSEEVMATAEIEGERLDARSVRSSIARRLGLADDRWQTREVDGLVDVVEDASQGYLRPLDADRLWRWQSALFPGGTSGLRRIAVGRYRDHEDPMQIVSGKLGREIVHYEAPPSAQVPAEMEQFLAWFAASTPLKLRPLLVEPAQESVMATAQMQPIARAAIAHLWFESIHPFEDGNGRIGRAIVEMAVAQHLGGPTKLFSLAGQFLRNRRGYYDALNAAQRGSLDITSWIHWFAAEYGKACEHACNIMDTALQKARFWSTHTNTTLNERQRKVVQRLLDDGDGGFQGGLNAEKYAKMTEASKPTATRDLAGMVEAGLLWTTGRGRAVRYYLNVPGWTHGVKVPRAEC